MSALLLASLWSMISLQRGSGESSGADGVLAPLSLAPAAVGIDREILRDWLRVGDSNDGATALKREAGRSAASGVTDALVLSIVVWPPSVRQLGSRAPKLLPA